MFSPRLLVRLSVLISGLLAACTTTQTSEPIAAIISQPTAQTQKALTLAVSKAVGSKVTLAPDSFTAKPSITIEPPSVNKRNGQIIDGRSLEMPTHIDLMMMGKDCFIVNRATGNKYPLTGVTCKAYPNAN